jgi:hypothetical protein
MQSRLFDSDYMPRFMKEYVHHVRGLVLNHAPIGAFRPIIEMRNGRVMLTLALERLISKVNFSRDLTHPQILFLFSTILNYAKVFAQNNDIDGQILAACIQQLPIISPFFVIALRSVILPGSPFFHFLMPQALALGPLSDEAAKEVILSSYRIVDLSEDDSLDRVVATVPQLLCAYFMGRPLPRMVLTDPEDPVERVIFATRMGMEQMLEHVQKMDVSPLEFVTIGSRFTHRFLIRFSVLLVKHLEQGTPRFWSFMNLVLASLLPTFSIGSWLKEGHELRYREALVRVMIKSCLPTFCTLAQDDLIVFLLQSVAISLVEPEQGQNLLAVTRLLLFKLLRAGPPRLTPAIVDTLCACGDIVTILEYIDSLTGFTQVYQADGLAAVQAALSRLIDVLPFAVTRTSSLEIVSCDKMKVQCARLNLSSAAKCSRLLSVLELPDRFDPRRWPEQMPPPEFAALIRVFCQTRLLQRPSTAQTLTDALISYLIDAQSTVPEESTFARSFRFTGRDYLFPALQFVFQALLRCGNENCALALLDALTPGMRIDSTLLAWIWSLVLKHFQFLTPRIRSILRTILGGLPHADRYFLTEPDQMRDIIRRINQAELWMHQGPEILLREIQSEKQYGMRMLMSSVLLFDWDPMAIVCEFLRPFREFQYVLTKREAFCNELAGIVGHMPAEIAYPFFREVMSVPLHDFIVRSMRVFLIYCSLDVFQRICINASDLLAHDDQRLLPFMLMIMPNFERFSGDEEVATKLLCGLLETVGSSTPIRLQERVMDAVGLIYVVFKMHKSRTRLINAAKNFAPDLKTMIASSLDIEFDFTQGPTLHEKAMPGSGSLRFTPNGLSVL